MTDVDLNRTAEWTAQPDDGDTVPPCTDARPRHWRIRVWTRSALRDVGYCAAVLAWSIACFTILVTGVAVTASLLFLVIGVFVWIGFVHVMRWTTGIANASDGSATSASRRPTADRPIAGSSPTCGCSALTRRPGRTWPGWG